jgi:hypothetical protein
MNGTDALVDYPGQRRGPVELNDRVDTTTLAGMMGLAQG